MKSQGRRAVRGIASVLVHRWRWVRVSGVCLAIICIVALAPAPRSAPSNHSPAEVSLWAWVVDALLDDHRADHLTDLQSPSQDPAMQGVVGYLHAHEVIHESLWDQVIGRVRSLVDWRDTRRRAPHR